VLRSTPCARNRKGLPGKAPDFTLSARKATRLTDKSRAIRVPVGAIRFLQPVPALPALEFRAS
jgi:hypothetical protein